MDNNMQNKKCHRGIVRQLILSAALAILCATITDIIHGVNMCVRAAAVPA
jgi:hypothetical protein